MSFWEANAVSTLILIINDRWLFQSACNSQFLLCNKLPQDLGAYNNYFITAYESIGQPGSSAVSWRDGWGAGGPDMASATRWPEWAGEISYMTLPSSRLIWAHTVIVLGFPSDFFKPPLVPHVPVPTGQSKSHDQPWFWGGVCLWMGGELMSLWKWACLQGWDGRGGIWGQFCDLPHPSS